MRDRDQGSFIDAEIVDVEARVHDVQDAALVRDPDEP
jgi:hypothetical protein